ncbi:hypothetical protein LWC34_49870 [Kibdelosporangium philippinense]|uniref:Lipoprotein n=1 Tax=Kibdelosporangium philippinense TaxID=211113 RepID=A0ABS8ZT08_9PSEU|nr:hypothetical protein [Kibdelosporangium philippinense]MCE7010860.1 hypothetical protein [Kibdelosporangium philippinense]
MKSGKLALCALLAAPLLACGGGDEPVAQGSSGDGPAAPAAEPAKRPVFEDFPGEGVVYTESGASLGLKVKAIDSTWAAEVMDKPANPGYHFLAVWVAVTPALADRGMDNVKIDDEFYVRFKPAGSTCNGTQPVDKNGNCYAYGKPGSQLQPLLSAEWRTASWSHVQYTRSDIKRGETRFAQIGFSIDDKVQATSFELCVPTKEASNEFVKDKMPCTPVKAPDGSR